MCAPLLPTINACLNFMSAVLLTLGYSKIRQKKILEHRMCMITAFVISIIFLVLYIIHHYQHPITRFRGIGMSRYLYFSILISHTMLAVTVPFFAIATLYRALKGQIEKHRAIAKIALPIWLYVSVTGVLVYLMLYIIF